MGTEKKTQEWVIVHNTEFEHMTASQYVPKKTNYKAYVTKLIKIVYDHIVS